MTPTTLDKSPKNDANRLGLDYRAEAAALPYPGPIVDAHTHISTIEAARLYFEVAELFGIEKTWSMSPLEQVDALRAEFGDRIEFIAVPNYAAREKPDTFNTDWLRRIEAFAEKGVRVCKFWAAPRGIDLSDDLRIDAPIRREGMRLARSLDMMFMAHIADPDTWFATKYADSRKYGTKDRHFEAFERTLDEYNDVTWIAAHMAGSPEDLDRLRGLLDRHPNLYLDTSATKWMVRELSKHPRKVLCDFFQNFRGRVLFGSDIVANKDNMDFDLFASRYWALRTLLETDYEGPSPIVDPDLHMIDESVPEDATAALRGARLDRETLDEVYHGAVQRITMLDGPVDG